VRTAIIGLWSVYLALAPVYWFVGISVSALANLKFALVTVAVFLTWFEAIRARTLELPRTFVFGPLGFLVYMTLGAPGVFQALDHRVVSSAKDLTLGYIMLWSFYFIQRQSGGAGAILRNCALILSLFMVLTVTSAFLGFPQWFSPAPWNTHVSIGFGGKSTKWSNALGIYMPILVGYLAMRYRTGLGTAVAVAGGLLVMTSQVLSGGRGGIVASIAGFAVLSTTMLKARQSLAIVAVLLAVFIPMRSFVIEQFRLDPLTSGARDFSALDDFSSGRLQGFRAGLDLIGARPFTGYGFGIVEDILEDEYSIEVQIHNMWLRLAADTGVLLPMYFSVFVFVLLRRTFQMSSGRAEKNSLRPGVKTRVDLFKRVMAACVVSGLTAAMFSPNVLVGSFQNEAVWWAVAGVIIAVTESDHSPRSVENGAPTAAKTAVKPS